ncbi:MAG: hypothetical protein AB1776_02720 [Bacillota bacterium]
MVAIRERSGVFLLILVICLALLQVGGAAGETPVPQDRRQEALRLYHELGRRERALATDLLRLDGRLLALRQEAEALRRDLARLEAERERCRQTLGDAERKAAAAREKLKRWLVARYEMGNLALVAVLFEASGWEEVAYRAELVARLAAYEACLFREARRTVAAHREALARLRRTGDEIAARERELGVQAARLTETREARAALLARIRAEAAEAAASVSALERYWFDSLTSLKEAFRVLQRLCTTGRLRPDGVSLGYEGLSLEISDKSLEAQLRAAGGRDMPAVAITRGGITLTGARAGYELRGRLVATGGGTTARFQPEALLLGGVPVQEDVLVYAGGEPLLTLNLAGMPGHPVLRDVRHENGRLILLIR